MPPRDRPSQGAVVVGVDGSAQSLVAVDLAAQEARLRARPLHVVHGMVEPYLHVLSDPLPDSELRQHAEHVVADAVTRATHAVPEVEVSGTVVSTSGAHALINASHHASLVVVGDRGLGAFAGILVGSVAVHVAGHAACPVLIARGALDPALPVLVAVDGSPTSDLAIGFAFEEAALRKAPLVALHVWAHPASQGADSMMPLVYDEALVEREEANILAQALTGWRDKYGQVAVSQRVIHGHVRKTIIDASSVAQLVVAGARGRGGFTGLLLGSVSQAITHHAACPTAIVPHHHEG